MAVFLIFLLSLAAGSLSTLFWIPEAQLGRGYFQMNALIVLGLLGLAAAVTLVHPFAVATVWGPTLLWASFAAVFAYYAAIWRQRWRWGRLAAALATAGAGGSLLGFGQGLLGAAAAPLPHGSALLGASLISSALILGWSLIAMLLGHWYLVAPKLTFRHLVGFCWALLGTILLRLVCVAGSVRAAARVDPLIDPNPLRILISLAGQGPFFWFRLLWGLAMPVLLAIMALRCAQQKSNQSATGILYVLLIGTFIGEVTGLYLTMTTGVPV